jgi:hypothetical protein
VPAGAIGRAALAGSARALPPTQIIDAEPPAALPPPAPNLPDVALLSDVLAELPRVAETLKPEVSAQASRSSGRA